MEASFALEDETAVKINDFHKSDIITHSMNEM
jgi:hypothetical protein